MRTGEGAGAGGEIDPADLWVLDPATGEYRMRRPGERPPPPAPQPPPGPAVAAARRTPAPGRASRRRRQPAARTGLWVAGALCFLLAVGGVSAFVLARGGRTADSTAAVVSRASCTPAPSKPTPEPTAGVEPPVSGSFLNGAKADPIDIRVTVLDGTGTFGQAEAVLQWMQNTKDYLRSSNGGPAPAVIPRTTLVYAPNHVSQARALAAAMGLPASALHGDGTTSELIGRMVLTLGQDFHGIGKPFSVPAPAVPSAPATTGAGPGADGTNGCGSQ